ncbi:MAG: thiamine-monophosphate kinase [Candidatus Hodarchaeota archaeon]
MENNFKISNLGEIELIQQIEELVYEKTGQKLIRDDCFFFSLANKIKNEKIGDLVFNSDMLVSTTDVPPQMSAYQTGRKAVLMNISDLIVKGVKPIGIFISLGLPKDMYLRIFRSLISGIIDYCKKLELEYIGGDLNETKEIIINPTVFGIQDPSKLIYRAGIKAGDYLVANRKFGLTGVGFDILLSKSGNIGDFALYQKSINSIIEPDDIGYESYILSENTLATASIDSSDGLAKSLIDLMHSNPNIGFEIEFNEQLIDEEAQNYSNKFKIPLEDLVFNAGEEFIHLFTIDPKDYDTAKKLIRENNGQIYLIGKVISERKIFFLSKGKKNELKYFGFEHFK